MNRAINPVTLILISAFLLACSSLSLPGAQPTAIPPVFTPEPVEIMELTAETVSETGPEGENLLAGLPAGFKVDYQATQENQTITEMVPEGETVQDWTTMVTVQVYLGERNTTPEQAKTNLTEAWLNACQNSESYPVADGAENGYDFVLWQLYCPLYPSTQREEYTYLKAIQGNDSFYLVQVAFRYTPSEDDITQWMSYLREVQACDSRIPERACP